MASKEEIAYANLNKRIYNLIKRFDKEHGVLVTEVEYNSDIDGSIGEESTTIKSSIMFFGTFGTMESKYKKTKL
jgi:hypothetical protein